MEADHGALAGQSRAGQGDDDEGRPITYLEQMVKPMLVIQGANDPRVVKAESDQIVAALQAQGTDVEYMVLEDEGHGFSNENEIAVYRRMQEFLERYHD